MRYESMSQKPKKQFRLPPLVGGLHVSTDASLIADDELADVCNLSADHGVLATRDALRAADDGWLVAQKGDLVTVDRVWRQPIEVDGELCAIVCSAASDSYNTSDVILQAVTMDGECLASFAMHFAGAEHRFAIVPCDKATYGGDFLVLYSGRVYVADANSHEMRLLDADHIYAPLAMVNAKSVVLQTGETPDPTFANGEWHEPFNILTRRYRVSYTPSVVDQGMSLEYYILPTPLEIGSDVTLDIRTHNGSVCITVPTNQDLVEFELGSVSYYAWASMDGYVTLSTALPVSEFPNTVTITCERRMTSHTSMFGVSQALWYDSRLVLANGSQSTLLWSDANRPLYFPEENVAVVGDASQSITALDKQDNMLVVFKEREILRATSMHNQTDARVEFASVSPQIGCRCPQTLVLCHDRLVWMDADARVYVLVSSNTGSECNVREIGVKIHPFLLDNTTETQRKQASAVDHKGRYRLMIGHRLLEFGYQKEGFTYTKQPAWFAHRFDGFQNTDVPMIIGDGTRQAFVLNTGKCSPTYTLMRTVYRFDEHQSIDRYVSWDAQANVAVVDVPIRVSLTTKTFEFDAGAYKRLQALFVRMQAEDARVKPVADGCEPSHGIRFQSDKMTRRLRMPGIKRCRDIALTIEATGSMRLQDIVMQYTTFGTVK